MSIQPHVLLVPPDLYKVADRLLHTKILNIIFGNYQMYQYREDKPHWERVKHRLKRPSKFNLYSVIRTRYDDEEYALIDSFHLPKAMRKQGYYVEKIWEPGYMQTDYDPKICRHSGV